MQDRMRATLRLQCGRLCLYQGALPVLVSNDVANATLTCTLIPHADGSQVIEALLDGAFAPGAPHGAAEAHVAMLALATAAIDDRRAIIGSDFRP